MKHNFKELHVWTRTRKLVREVYQMTAKYPKEERFGITTQMRRAALSISLNLIEGTGRTSDKQLQHFLDIALGSAKELQGLFIHSYDLNFLSLRAMENYEKETIEIQKMLFGFRRSLMHNNVEV